MTPVATQRQLETVKAVIDAYIAGESSKFYGDSDRLKHLTEFATDSGSLRVDDLRADVLRNWVEAHPQWKSDWTKGRIARMIVRAFAWATGRLLIPRNPFRSVRYSDGPRGVGLDDAQFRLLLRHSSPELRRVLFFMRLANAKPSDVTALRWNHLDSVRGKFVIPLTTKRSRRDRRPGKLIKLPVVVLSMICWLADHQRVNPDQAVFLNERGEPWTIKALDLRLWRLRAALQIPAHARISGARI